MPGRDRIAGIPTAPIIREVLDLIDRSTWHDWQVAKAAGVNASYISHLRTRAKTDSSIACIDALLGVFGRRLVIGSVKSGKPGSPKYRRKPKGVKPQTVRPRVPYAGKDD